MTNIHTGTFVLYIERTTVNLFASVLSTYTVAHLTVSVAIGEFCIAEEYRS